MVDVDRETAGRLGVSMQAINDALNDAFGQRQISTIYAQANQYRVMLEAAPQYQSDPSALSRSTCRRHPEPAAASSRRSIGRSRSTRQRGGAARAFAS